MHISMVYKSTHIIALIGCLFFVGSLVVCVLFFQHVEQKKTILTELRTAYAQVEQNRGMLATLVQTLDDTKDERLSLLTRVLTEERIITFLSLIESVGREQQVALKTNSIAIQPINNTFETVVVSVTVKGSYDALLKTLTLFENIPYQSTVRNVQFRHVEDTDEWEAQYDIYVTKYKKV